MEADARVDAVETEAKKRIDVIRRENEDKVLSLEADLTQAKNRADRAEQWVMLIRREIEEHLMPAMRDAPKPTSFGGTPTVIDSTHAISLFGKHMVSTLWLRITTTAVSNVGCQRTSGSRNDIRRPTSDACRARSLSRVKPVRAV